MSDAVVEVGLAGHVTSDVIAQASAELWRLVAGASAAAYVVIDAVGVTGFDAAIAPEASAASRRFRDRGGREYVVIGASGTLRMMGAAVAASSSVPFRFFDTRAGAFEHLRARGAW